jgi:energy-coupling factor transporter ATP-binding protein EcfA2
MNDDFVPAGKAKKNKKVPKKQQQATPAAKPQAQQQQQPAPVAEALDWENDDFVPASKKKNKKGKPPANANAQNAQAQKSQQRQEEEEEPATETPATGGESLDWENEEFVKPTKNKKRKGKPAFVPPPEPVAKKEPEPVVEPAPKVEEAPEPEKQPEPEPEPVAAAAVVEPEPEPVVEEKVEEPEPVPVKEPVAKAEPVEAAAQETEQEEEKKPMFDENGEYIGPAIDWSEPEEDEKEDDGNPIPKHLRDIFEKDAKPSVRRSSGSVTTGVRLEGVSKTFKNMPILDGVSWDCKKGERVGLVGWNGAGKTTQLRIITGEMEADEGEIMLADGVKIGYLTQEFEVKESNTVREEFMASYGDETKIMRDIERINKELENNPGMDLVQILVDKLTDLQRQADRMDLFKMERAIDKIMPELGFVPRITTDSSHLSVVAGRCASLSVRFCFKNPVCCSLTSLQTTSTSTPFSGSRATSSLSTSRWLSCRTIASFWINSAPRRLKSSAARRPRTRVTTLNTSPKRKAEARSKWWRTKSGKRRCKDSAT